MSLPSPGPAARLAIFDVDGTLTDTNAVHIACYFWAAAAVYGPAAARADWAGAPHVSDAAIAHWLAEAHLGRPPRADEFDAHRAGFLVHLREALACDPAGFAPVPGAPGLLVALRVAGWHVALATGSWGASARLKLAATGVADGDVPLASADDGRSREDIVRAAAERAGAPLEAWGRAVSVGDGAWDVRTAATLGLRVRRRATSARMRRGVGACRGGSARDGAPARRRGESRPRRHEHTTAARGSAPARQGAKRAPSAGHGITLHEPCGRAHARARTATAAPRPAAKRIAPCARPRHSTARPRRSAVRPKRVAASRRPLQVRRLARRLGVALAVRPGRPARVAHRRCVMPLARCQRPAAPRLRRRAAAAVTTL